MGKVTIYYSIFQKKDNFIAPVFTLILMIVLFQKYICWSRRKMASFKGFCVCATGSSIIEILKY